MSCDAVRVCEAPCPRRVPRVPSNDFGLNAHGESRIASATSHTGHVYSKK